MKKRRQARQRRAWGSVGDGECSQSVTGDLDMDLKIGKKEGLEKGGLSPFKTPVGSKGEGRGVEPKKSLY